MSEDNERARDPGVTVWEFSGLIWVVCPKCGGPARVTHDDGANRSVAQCLRCAWFAERRDAAASSLGLPLYLATRVRGNELVVHNLAHLDALAAWLGASLRERPAPDAILRNKTMMSRLPRWMKVAAARPHIVKALAELRRKAEREGLA